MPRSGAFFAPADRAGSLLSAAAAAAAAACSTSTTTAAHGHGHLLLLVRDGNRWLHFDEAGF